MSRQPSVESFSPTLVEALEARIAPAVITVGGSSTTTYDSVGTPFVLASASTDADIAALFATSTNSYYIDLGSQDQLNYLNVGGTTSFIDMDAGRTFAFFTDFNNDHKVDSNELTGLSLAAGTSAKIGFGVNGAILTNLDGKTGDFAMNLIGDTQSIKKLSVAGEVDGSILAGGSITDLSAGAVHLIGTGTVGNGQTFDLGGLNTVGKGQGTLGAITLAVKKAAPSISKVTVSSVDSILASDGGESGAGGSISSITLQNDSDGFTIQAGAGGAGTVNGVGGAGGKVSGVVVWGVDGDATNSLISIKGGNGGAGAGTGSGGAGGLVEKIYVGYQQSGSSYVKSPDFLLDHVVVDAGDGGAGKKGGLGGSLSTINVRVATAGDTVTKLGISLLAGNGGASTDAAGTGGNGGNITNYYLLNNNDDATLAIVDVIGGDGGAGGSSGGIGGNVKTGVILSQSVFAESGDGGSGTKKGGAAGSLDTLQIAYRGDAALIQFNQQESNLLDIYAEDVRLRAGTGGAATTAGNGGNGGSILKVAAPLTDLDNFTINTETLNILTGVYSALNGADGGAGAAGNGGNGGLINGIHFDSDTDSANEVGAVFRTGNGGVGDKKGGTGGNFLSSSFFLNDATITATTGSGGTSATGSGGNGGLVNDLTLSALGQVGGVNAFVSLVVGNGGDAQTSGKGGSGGSLTSISARATGDVTVTSGSGGATDTGSAGNGGAISKATLSAGNTSYSFIQTQTLSYNSLTPSVPPVSVIVDSAAPINGSAILTAGSGGIDLVPATDVKVGGNGGSISNVNVQGLKDVKILAGDGTLGGYGGNVQTAVLNGAEANVILLTHEVDTSTGDDATYYAEFDSGIFGDVEIAAGDGANGAKAGGKGGSLLNITGVTGFRSSATAVFTAGNGGDGTLGTGGAGGSITTLSIGSGSVSLSVVAGNGGDSLAQSAGGLGGSVKGVSVSGKITKVNTFAEDSEILTPEIVTALTVQKIAAGDGGNTAVGTKGANGGSVSLANVYGDIGVRYGQTYGFNAMGGIFAGAAGTGAVSNGIAGNVTDISASSIASIVAGRAASPQLVTKVDGISLSPIVKGDLVVNLATTTSITVGTPASSFSNVSQANYVGGISDPSNANASQFLTTAGRLTDDVNSWTLGTDSPLDGLVAALTLGKKGNGTNPNAWLTKDTSGSYVLVSKFNL